VLLVFVTACWSSSQPAAANPPTTPEPVASSRAFRPRPTMSCGRTISGMLDKMRAELVGIPEATIDEMVDSAIESCGQMGWSADLLACYDGAAGSTDLERCQPLMTAEQTEDFTRRMMDIVSRMNQLPPPPPTP